MKDSILEPLHLAELSRQEKLAPDGNCVRRFIIPSVNLGDKDYVDLTDWQDCYVTPPAVLRQISSHELLKTIQDDVPMVGWDFIIFPSHT
ncbi:hypothetical protein AVEN_28601-1 [Araneus ventricosus]|uniref:Uncharacterized protein n=1 Tax=Araneus ventricosus TaxID=182803 RepID=A0A4Y2DFH8_ARAVE|nr:hypothetical protein AVEN_28601-1 [Araneus ventricosus]